MEHQNKVLVIDDDPDFVAMVKLVLESKSYQVLSAASVEEGLQKAKSEKPDAILLDVMMPDGTEGFHFVWQLRADPDPECANIPIIIITALHETTKLRLYPEVSDSTYGPGEFLPVQAFIDKPVDPIDLVAAMKWLLKK